jgi:hypothetical protein
MLVIDQWLPMIGFARLKELEKAGVWRGQRFAENIRRSSIVPEPSRCCSMNIK